MPNSEINLISHAFLAQSWYDMQLCYSFSRFFMDYRWLVNREVAQKKKRQCKSAAGCARRSSGMLLVFDIPPSLPLFPSLSHSVSLCLSLTHTLFAFPSSPHPHLSSFPLMLNFYIVGTLYCKCTLPYSEQLWSQLVMHTPQRWFSIRQDVRVEGVSYLDDMREVWGLSKLQ